MDVSRSSRFPLFARVGSTVFLVLLGLSAISVIWPWIRPVEACGNNTACTNTFVGVQGQKQCRGCSLIANSTIATEFVGDTVIYDIGIVSKTTAASTITGMWATFTTGGSGAANFTKLSQKSQATAVSNLDSEMWYLIIPHTGVTCASCTLTAHIRTNTAVNFLEITAGTWRSASNGTLLIPTPISTTVTTNGGSFTFSSSTVNLPANGFAYEWVNCGAQRLDGGGGGYCATNQPLAPATSVQGFTGASTDNFADGSFFAGSSAYNNFQFGIKIGTVCQSGCTGGSYAAMNFEAVALTPSTSSTNNCTTAATACYENGPACIITSGTTMTTGTTPNCPAWSGTYWPTSFFTQPFTEVIKVVCSTGNLNAGEFPQSVVSSNFGSMSDQINFGVGQSGTMTSTILGYLALGGAAATDTLSFSIWFVQVPSGTASTSDAITVTFGSDVSTVGTNTACMLITGAIGGKSGAAWSPAAWSVVQVFSGASGSVSPVTAQSTAFNIAAPAVVTADLAYSVQGASTQSYTLNNPMSNAGMCSFQNFCGINNFQMQSVGGTGPLDTESMGQIYESTYTGSFAQTFTPPPAGGNCGATGCAWQGTAVYVQWNAAGSSGTCSLQSCQGSGGSGGASGTFALKSNLTVFYQGTISAVAGFQIQNVTTKISAISWTNNAAATHHITLGIWQIANQCPVGHTCGGGLQGNTLPVTASNPLVNTNPPIFSQTYTFAGAVASPFYLHFYPVTAALLNGTTYAIGISTDHNGVTIYGSATGNPYNDTTDGYNPPKINVANVPALHIPFLQFTYLQPSVSISLTVITTVTTINTGSGSGGITTVYCSGSVSNGVCNTVGSGGEAPLFVFMLLFVSIPLLFVGLLAKFAGGAGAMAGLLIGITIAFIVAVVGGLFSPAATIQYLVLFGVADIIVLLLLLRSHGGQGAPAA